MTEIIRTGPVTINFLLDAAASNGSVTAFEFTVPPGAKVPLPHYHKHFDETLYGLEGVITFTADGRTVNIGPGDTCFVPRGAVHGFNNLQQTTSKTLAVITPGVLGPQYFKDVAAVLDAGGPPDIQKIRAAMEKHGLIPVLPKT